MVNIERNNDMRARKLGHVLGYSDKWLAQTCTQAGATSGGGSPKTGAINGRIWTKREGNNIPVQANNVEGVSTITVGAWVEVSQRIGSTELDITKVMFAENVTTFGVDVAHALRLPDPPAPELNQSLLTIRNNFNLRPYVSSGLILRARSGWLGGLYWDDTLTLDLDSHKTSTSDRKAGVVAYIYDNAGTLEWGAVTGADLELDDPKTPAYIESALALAPSGSFPVLVQLLADDATTMNVNDSAAAEDVRNTWAFGGGGSGIVESVVGGFGIDVDDTDAANPIVNLDVTGTTTSTASGTVNALDVGADLLHTFVWSGGSAYTINGIDNGLDGNMVIIVNAGTALLSLSHQSGSASEADRIISASGSGALLSPGQSAILRYQEGSVNRWREINPTDVSVYDGTTEIRPVRLFELDGDFFQAVNGGFGIAQVTLVDVPDHSADRVTSGTLGDARIDLGAPTEKKNLAWLTDTLAGRSGSANYKIELTDLLLPHIAQTNLVINGGMQVWQRGTSFGGVASATYLADRWHWRQSGGGVISISRSGSVPALAENSPVYGHSFLVTISTADTTIASTDHYGVCYRMLGYDFRAIAQRAFVVSFWVWSSKTGTHCVCFRNGGGGSTDRTYVAEYTVNSAGTWEYKTIIVPASPSAGTWSYENDYGLDIRWMLAAGSNFHTTAGAWQTGNFLSTSSQVNVVDNTANAFRITGIDIRPGEIVVPYFPRSLADEERLCKTYYQKTYGRDTNPATASAQGYWKCEARSTSLAPVLAAFETEMRAAPTITIYPFDGSPTGVISTFPAGTDIGTTVAATGVTTKGVSYLSDSGAGLTSGTLYIFHMTADAEI